MCVWRKWWDFSLEISKLKNTRNYAWKITKIVYLNNGKIEGMSLKWQQPPKCSENRQNMCGLFTNSDYYYIIIDLYTVEEREKLRQSYTYTGTWTNLLKV